MAEESVISVENLSKHYVLGHRARADTLRDQLTRGFLSVANTLIGRNKAKTAVQYIGSFEDAVAQAARKRGVDTVVCGHIHRAEIRDINGILYCNDGDWVESCTSLVEDMNGHLRLIDWPKFCEQARATAMALPVGQAA